MTNDKKITAGGNPAAEVNLHSHFATKIRDGQTLNSYSIEVSYLDCDTLQLKTITIEASDEARSLLLIALTKNGVSRAEALEKYSILSLTQHVHKIRKKCSYWHVIETEIIKPKGYGRYHLPPDIKLRLFTLGGK